jgi:hypothetical protein
MMRARFAAYSASEMAPPGPGDPKDGKFKAGSRRLGQLWQLLGTTLQAGACLNSLHRWRFRRQV